MSDHKKGGTWAPRRPVRIWPGPSALSSLMRRSWKWKRRKWFWNWQLDQEHFKREISSCAHDAGRACIIDTLYNGRFDDKRHYLFPSCAVFSAHKRRALLCKESAYGFRLLGGVLMSVHLGFHWSITPSIWTMKTEAKRNSLGRKEHHERKNVWKCTWLGGKAEIRQFRLQDLWLRVNELSHCLFEDFILKFMWIFRKRVKVNDIWVRCLPARTSPLFPMM